MFTVLFMAKKTLFMNVGLSKYNVLINIFMRRKLFLRFKYSIHVNFNNYIILDGLEGDTRIYCQRC